MFGKNFKCECVEKATVLIGKTSKFDMPGIGTIRCMH